MCSRLRSGLPFGVSLMLLSLAVGCGSGDDAVSEIDRPQEMPAQRVKAVTDAVAKAKSLCQREQYREAIDVLNDVAGAEAAYLRSVALYELESYGPALVQSQAAVRLEPKTVRYLGCHYRIRLSQKDLTAAPKLVTLYRDHPESPHAAFFGFYGLELTRATFLAQNKMEEATQMRGQSILALQTAIDLSSGAPELQPSMLEQAVRSKFHSQVEQVAEVLRKTRPNDEKLAAKSLNARLSQDDDANVIAEAKQFYERSGQTEQAAVLYARALAKVGLEADPLEEFRGLSEAFPRQPDIATLRAMALAKRGRPVDAVEVLTQAANRYTEGEAKQQLVRASIVLPLDQGNLDLAEVQFARHRQDLNDPMLANYFQGRLHVLRGNDTLALASFNKILKARERQPQLYASLGDETLRWVARIVKRIQEGQKSGRIADEVDRAIRDGSAGKTQPKP